LLIVCGRGILYSPLVELQRAFEFSETPNMMGRYNIAPTQRVPIVRHRVGSWAKDVKRRQRDALGLDRRHCGRRPCSSSALGLREALGSNP
jgi:putative SOS response-associated peptidase YedK